MNKPLILVVEDDAPVRNLITTTLKAHDYKFITAQNGNNAIMEASSHNPDIVLLDLGLPDMDGVEVIERIRTWSDMPIIVISARSEDKDKIDALDAGADDYVTKPCSPSVLMKRVAALLRRSSSSACETSFTIGELTLDVQAHDVQINGKSIPLAFKEYSILYKLIANFNCSSSNNTDCCINCNSIRRVDKCNDSDSNYFNPTNDTSN